MEKKLITTEFKPMHFQSVKLRVVSICINIFFFTPHRHIYESVALNIHMEIPCSANFSKLEKKSSDTC